MTVETTTGRGGNGRGRQAPKVVRCAAYTRQSVTDDREVFTSLDAQFEAIEAFARSQRSEGWVLLPERYADAGLSGASLARPALRHLLSDVAAGKVDSILVYKVDRLSRSLLGFAEILGILNAHGTSFVSVTEQFSTATPTGRLHMNMLMSFAEYERALISQRTADKMGAAKRRGKWVGGVPVLGYDVAPEGGRLLVNEAEAARVRGIFALYLEQGSLSATVAELRHQGWHCKRWTTQRGEPRGGTPFTKSTLSLMLSNVVYRGQVAYRGEVFAGEHPAIVDEDLWQRVQAQLAKGRAAGGSATRNKHGALLQHLVFCGPCGCRMTHTFSKRTKRDGSVRLYRFYTCVKANKEGRASCATRSISAGDLEGFVVDRIRGIGRDPAVVAETLAAAFAQLKEQIAALENDRRLIEAELAQLDIEMRRAAAEGVRRSRGARLSALEASIDAAETRLADVTRQIDALRGQEINEADVTAALGRFDDVWAALTPREQAHVIQLLVEKVVVDGRTDEVELTFKPTGIRALAEENGA